MAKRSGSADLPLHGGRVPAWLGERMTRLGTIGAIRRLDEQARRLERHVSGPSFESVMAEERQRSNEYGGRSIFGWEAPDAAAATG